MSTLGVYLIPGLIEKYREMFMNDKAFNIFLIIIIGVPAVALLLISLSRQMPANQMVLTIIVSAAGLIWVFIRALSLRSFPDRKVDTREKLIDQHKQ